MKVAQ